MYSKPEVRFSDVQGKRGPGNHLERRLRSQNCTDLGRHPGTRHHLERPQVGNTRRQYDQKMCRAAFGTSLTIVGEEDPPSKEVKTTALAEEELPDGFVIPEDLQNLVFSDITVFIDPVDGTREFVEGRLEAVTSLLGVSYRGRAVAGIMGIPFHPSREVQVVLGVVGSPSGLVGVPSEQKKSELNEFVLAISADLGAKEVNFCRQKSFSLTSIFRPRSRASLKREKPCWLSRPTPVSSLPGPVGENYCGKGVDRIRKYCSATKA